jgi:hypothetical protein
MRARVYFGEYSGTHVLAIFAELANVAITFVCWFARLAGILQTLLWGLASLAHIRQTVLWELTKLARSRVLAKRIFASTRASPQEWPLPNPYPKS